MKKLLILVVTTVASFALYAQKANADLQKNKPATELSINYSCPMHPDVSSDKPGKCPKCNMDLSLSKKEQMKKEVMGIYTCPMHKEVISERAGACPKCGNNLLLSAKEKMKTDVAGKYQCPMHPGATSTKAGKCPECNMDMKKMKAKTKIAG